MSEVDSSVANGSGDRDPEKLGAEMASGDFLQLFPGHAQDPSGSTLRIESVLSEILGVDKRPDQALAGVDSHHHSTQPEGLGFAELLLRDAVFSEIVYHGADPRESLLEIHGGGAGLDEKRPR